jgi:FKBP-type peptidyl-prolyl cis-trans isomerase
VSGPGLVANTAATWEDLTGKGGVLKRLLKPCLKERTLPTIGDTVLVNYVGTYAGKEFDSSVSG